HRGLALGPHEMRQNQIGDDETDDNDEIEKDWIIRDQMRQIVHKRLPENDGRPTAAVNFSFHRQYRRDFRGVKFGHGLWLRSRFATCSHGRIEASNPLIWSLHRRGCSEPLMWRDRYLL